MLHCPLPWLHGPRTKPPLRSSHCIVLVLSSSLHHQKGTQLLQWGCIAAGATASLLCECTCRMHTGTAALCQVHLSSGSPAPTTTHCRVCRHPAGTVSGVQASLQSAFEILSFAAGTAVSKPEKFHWLMTGSCTAVGLAACLYYSYACLPAGQWLKAMYRRTGADTNVHQTDFELPVQRLVQHESHSDLP